MNCFRNYYEPYFFLTSRILWRYFYPKVSEPSSIFDILLKFHYAYKKAQLIGNAFSSVENSLKLKKNYKKRLLSRAYLWDWGGREKGDL